MTGILALAALVTTSACGGDNDDATPRRSAAAATVAYPADSPCPPLKQRVALTQPIVAPSAASAWMYVAEAQGLFDACGLDVTIKQADTPAQAAGYLAGETSMAVMGGGFPAVIAATGKPISVLGLLGNSAVFAFMGKQPVTGPDDLRGATIGVNSTVDSTYKVALAYLSSQGVRPEEVTFRALKSIPNIAAALQSGAVKFGVVSPPTTELLKAKGVQVIKDFSAEPLDNPTNAVIARPDWLAEHPDAAANMLRAIVAAVYQVERDPSVASEPIAEALKIDGSTADGKAALDAAVEAARRSYRPVRDILTVDAGVLELFRSTAPADVAERLQGKDMSALLPANDIGAALLGDGFLEQLEKLYGPLPES